jgi:hypothetical protein
MEVDRRPLVGERTHVAAIWILFGISYEFFFVFVIKLVVTHVAVLDETINELGMELVSEIDPIPFRYVCDLDQTVNHLLCLIPKELMGITYSVQVQPFELWASAAHQNVGVDSPRYATSFDDDVFV